MFIVTPYSFHSPFHTLIFWLRLHRAAVLVYNREAVHIFLGPALMPFVVYAIDILAEPAHSIYVYVKVNVFLNIIISFYRRYISNDGVRSIKHREIEFGYSIES